MVVDKRTVLNENRERFHVRWTAKRGNEIVLNVSIECGVTPLSFPGVDLTNKVWVYYFRIPDLITSILQYCNPKLVMN